MTLIPEIEEALIAAARQRAKRARRASRVPMRRGLLIALIVILVSASAVAATKWSPRLGDDTRGHPTASDSAPPNAQLALFGVLRREQTKADRGKDARYALSLFPASQGGIRTDYVRLLGTFGKGLGVVLVPRAGGGARRDVLCLWMRDPVDGGGGSCYTTADILSGHGFVGMVKAAPKGGATIPGPDGKPVRAPGGGPMTIAGLVPDGVARVRWGDAEAAVKDNFFLLQGPTPGRKIGPPVIEWLNRSGQFVAQQPEQRAGHK